MGTNAFLCEWFDILQRTHVLPLSLLPCCVSCLICACWWKCRGILRVYCQVLAYAIVANGLYLLVLVLSYLMCRSGIVKQFRGSSLIPRLSPMESWMESWAENNLHGTAIQNYIHAWARTYCTIFALLCWQKIRTLFLTKSWTNQLLRMWTWLTKDLPS